MVMMLPAQSPLVNGILTYTNERDIANIHVILVRQRKILDRVKILVSTLNALPELADVNFLLNIDADQAIVLVNLDDCADGEVSRMDKMTV